MKVVYEYSHLGGSEILNMCYPGCEQDIYAVIAQVIAAKTKVSEEKTMAGRNLYSPADMNRRFRERFAARGYRELRERYTITLPNSPVTIPGAFKQIDFVKGKVLVEVQFGKYFAIFYDMAKFQYFLTKTRLMSASKSFLATRFTNTCQRACRLASNWFTISNDSKGISQPSPSKSS